MSTVLPTISALERHFSASDEPAHSHVLCAAVRRGIGAAVVSRLRDHPLGDDWFDFTCQALTRYWQQRKGFLYLAVNPVNPQFHKLGKTRHDPSARLRALNNEAVVGSFVSVGTWAVYDRHALEAHVHRALGRFPRHKEFFVGDWRALSMAVAQCLADDERAFRELMLPVPTLSHELVAPAV